MGRNCLAVEGACVGSGGFHNLQLCGMAGQAARGMWHETGSADETRIRRLHDEIARRPWLAEYAFAIRSQGDVEALLHAEFEARESGVDLLTALFVAKRLSADGYAPALATALGVPLAGYDIAIDEATCRAVFDPRATPATPLAALWRGEPVLLVCATDAPPRVVAARVEGVRGGTLPVLLVAARPLQAAMELGCAKANLRVATSGLKRRLPQFSAGRGGPQWQPNLLAALGGVLIGAAALQPQGTLALLTVMLTVPFVGTVLVRLFAMADLLRPAAALQPPTARTPDRELPVYSFMVALYDEADVLETLVASLARLDYPATKLDGLLIIEDTDAATKAALLGMQLPPFMRVVIVPDGEPRTKPRALNYALTLARGDYVVVFDAEDRPEPDQLRRAYQAFEAAKLDGEGANVACVQARLNIYNARQSWLTRQFTVEYSALFDSVLPALQRLRLPMPLGGTSNHFPGIA